MKDRQSLLVFIVILGILIFAGILCYTQLEVVPDTSWTDPSREAKTNQYLALNRWLDGLGYSVRTISVGDVETVLQGPEKTVYIENSRFNWADKERLIPWLREGGRLIVSLDASANGQLAEFMETLGGIQEIDQWAYEGDDAGEDESDKEDPGKDNRDKEDRNEISKIPPRENAPFFWGTNFKIKTQNAQADRVLVMGNKYGAIKLVKAELGKGWVVFTGEAVFLHNFYLNQSDNVNLAGELFLAKDGGNESGSRETGTGENILFIRMLSGERHLFGNLAERGNPLALAVSIALLIITGFWMAIPVFGRFRPEPERPGKPLRERFLAEGRFLAKYHALGKYIEVYKKELEQRSRSRGIDVTLPSGALSLTFADFIREQQWFIENIPAIKQTLRPFTLLNHGRSWH
ncbi:MAG: DUF4350 domain-containing protein [Spirochaetaceae bacterium]|jgi:hypothetical protein|nr:DUF4350 domain-containing protein [Spirochaetaceae bacterium]